MKATFRSVFIGATAGAWLLGASVAAAAGWWNVNWPYRRLVTTSQVKRTGLGGEEVAVVTMPTGGLVRSDGADIRVVSPDGREMPCRVLMLGPGDTARVALAALPGRNRYYVYFGNRNPPKSRPLEIRRGVLLEMWEYPGGGIKTLEQIRKIFQAPKRLIGRDFRPDIFLGHNPFGPRNRSASIFTGYLICPVKGRYTFVSSSSNASFLLIDDELVVDNGGTHPPQRDVRMQGGIDLSAGLHKLTFYHVSGPRELIAVAAWRPPGRDRIRPIPANAFAPVASAQPGPMETYGRPITIDFVPRHLGETFMMNRYYQRYGFRAVSVGRTGSKIRWRWDFGDGQTSAETDVQHVYLRPGQYTVTLRAKTHIGELERVNRIYVSRPWDKVTSSRIDPVGDYAEIVAKYDFSKLPAAATMEAVNLLERAGRRDAVLAAGEAFARLGEAPANAVETVLTAYAEALLAENRAEQAAAGLQRGAQMTTNPAVCATMLTRAGQIMLREKSDPSAALRLFERVIRRYAALTTSPAVRLARIGIGDAWRARGDFERAMQAYKAAGVHMDLTTGKRAIRRGDFARHVEDFLRRRQYSYAAEYLDRWESAMPADRLEGYSTLLRVRLLTARKDHEAAAREAMVLVNINPASNYAAELLMLAAENYAALKLSDKSKAALRRIVEKYPESPLAAKAAGKLAGK